VNLSSFDYILNKDTAQDRTTTLFSSKLSRIIVCVFHVWSLFWFSSWTLVSDNIAMNRRVVTNIMEQPYRSIFYISVEGVGQCSGFPASDEVVITAAHCFKGAVKEIKVNIPEGGGKYRELIASDYVISSWYDPKSGANDYAAVYLALPVEREPFLLASFPGKAGDFVKTAGFPGYRQNYPHIEMWVSHHQVVGPDGHFEGM
jgi:hypothetical protein